MLHVIVCHFGGTAIRGNHRIFRQRIGGMTHGIFCSTLNHAGLPKRGLEICFGGKNIYILFGFDAYIVWHSLHYSIIIHQNDIFLWIIDFASGTTIVGIDCQFLVERIVNDKGIV